MKRCIPYLLAMVPLFAHAHWDSAYYHDSSMAGTTVKADWMKDLLDRQSIMQVSIPGTHESASRYGGPYAQTQTLDIPTQLRAGIRFLDVRAKYTNGSLAIHHGVVFQNLMFGDVLNQVKAYLKAHPTEFVLMRLKQEESNDANFPAIVNKYMSSPLYSDVVWRRNANSYSPPRVGDVRGKLVVLLDYDYSAIPGFGMSYYSFGLQDSWEVPTNWALYAKWEKVRNYLDYSQKPGITGLINYLVGSNIAFPYFVASGHSSPGTSAARLATGYTTPGWSWKWKDFPRVNCFIGICTIAFEGTNVLTRQYIDKINKKNGVGKDAAGGSLSSFGFLQNSAYVGVIVADFPGPGLIESVVAANRFYPKAVRK
ncbi:1-phosphatidylinositol phosphodiesterase [Pseudomonas sp. TE3786]